MVDMRLIKSAACSALFLCAGLTQTFVYPATAADGFIGPVCQQASKPGETAEYKSSVVIPGIYLPGFDVNRDGVFDSRDVEQITSERKARLADSIKSEPVPESEPTVTEIQSDTFDEPLTEETVIADEPVYEDDDTDCEDEADDFVMPEPREMRGIDVSKWQGNIDWERVKASGVEFVIIKAGEGTSVARNFYANISGAKEAGLACGIYWFSNARSYSEAVDEANACLEVASQYQLEFPVVCDFEYRSIEDCGNPLQYDRRGATDAILGFLGTIERGGFYSMLYTNRNFSSKYFEFDRISSEYDIWCAAYNASSPGLSCGIWQYSQYGHVDGIDTDNYGKAYVDLDVAYKDYPEIMKRLHINGF